MANSDDSGEERKKHVFQILSLDGGGIRGIFTAGLLNYFEEKLCRNNQRITDHFDLITGTSTGGIIALGLSTGLRPREIYDFYMREGDKIFASTMRKFSPLSYAKYPSEPLEAALKDRFDDKTLWDCTKRLVIPAYDIDSVETSCFLFKTPHSASGKFGRNYGVPIWQIGLATSAAPTYFPICKKIQFKRFIDGGMWANNPILIGIFEARKILQAQGIPESDYSIRVFSLGTGKNIFNFSNKMDDAGLMYWGPYLINFIMDGQSASANDFARQWIGKKNVLRIDPPLTSAVPLDSSPKSKMVIRHLLSKVEMTGNDYLSDFKEMFARHIAPEFIAKKSQEPNGKS